MRLVRVYLYSLLSSAMRELGDMSEEGGLMLLCTWVVREGSGLAVVRYVGLAHVIYEQ
jgi:hypothetical protein